MSSKKINNCEKNFQFFWDRVQILLKSLNINETEFRRKLIELKLSASYLSDLKSGRSKATGGKLWHAINIAFPGWADYLCNYVNSSPMSSKSSPGSTIEGKQIPYLAYTRENPRSDFQDKTWGKDIIEKLIELETLNPELKSLILIGISMIVDIYKPKKKSKKAL